MNDAGVGVALIGFGYWGRNFARNIVAHDRLELRWIVEPAPKQRAIAEKLYGSARLSAEYSQALADPECRGVIVATPADTHFGIARAAMLSGKHVIVTKPLAKSASEAEELVRMSEDLGLVGLVDNTFVYTGAVEKLCEIIEESQLGDLVYCLSNRVNLGTYRTDLSVLWDLGPHDASILDALGYGEPSGVSASAGGRMGGARDQVASMSLFYESGFIAHVNLSWLAPVKLRLMLFGGTERMAVYDDMAPSEKVRIYDNGVRVNTELQTDASSIGQTVPVEYRLGDMWAPRLDSSEALFKELSHFADCISRYQSTRSGFVSGLNTVRVLEAATKSAAMGGALCKLSNGPGSMLGSHVRRP